LYIGSAFALCSKRRKQRSSAPDRLLRIHPRDQPGSGTRLFPMHYAVTHHQSPKYLLVTLTFDPQPPATSREELPQPAPRPQHRGRGGG
jgi:hypothetical protein